MAYYSPIAGDYKTYGYAGDPGFLSSIWKVVKGVGKALIAPRLPIPIPLPFPRLPGPVGPPLPRLPIPIPLPMPGGGGGGGAGGVAGMCLPGPPGPTRGSVMPTNGCCPAGYHMEKAGRGYCVRNRRMNVTNPRSLRRAISRQKGFQRLASKVGYVKRKSSR